jgi:hypothetical protein
MKIQIKGTCRGLEMKKNPKMAQTDKTIFLFFPRKQKKQKDKLWLI